MKVGDIVRWKPNNLYRSDSEWEAEPWQLGLLIEKEFNVCRVSGQDGRIHVTLAANVQKAGKKDFNQDEN